MNNEKQRYISTTFWDDEWVQTLDPSEKLVYLYYMTNPLTNIAGVYKLTVKRICFDTGFNSDTVGHIQDKFEKAGKAFRIGEFIALPAWPKHQRWQTKDSIRVGIEAIIKELPEDIRAKLQDIGYCYPIHTRRGDNPTPSPQDATYSNSNPDINSDSNFNNDPDSISAQATPSPHNNNSLFDQDGASEPESESKPKGRKKVSSAPPDGEFEAFWASYPRKLNKADARKAYSKQVKAGAWPDEIMCLLTVYKAQILAQRTEMEYIKYPATFLRNLDNWRNIDSASVTGIPATGKPSPRGGAPGVDTERLKAVSGASSYFASKSSHPTGQV